MERDLILILVVTAYVGVTIIVWTKAWRKVPKLGLIIPAFLHILWVFPVYVYLFPGILLYQLLYHIERLAVWLGRYSGYPYIEVDLKPTEWNKKEGWVWAFWPIIGVVVAVRDILLLLYALFLAAIPSTPGLFAWLWKKLKQFFIVLVKVVRQALSEPSRLIMSVSRETVVLFGGDAEQFEHNMRGQTKTNKQDQPITTNASTDLNNPEPAEPSPLSAGDTKLVDDSAAVQEPVSRSSS